MTEEAERLDILHVTSAHPVWDTRIFVKEARTLAAAGYKVGIVGPALSTDRPGTERVDGVRRVTLPRAKGRFGRFTTFGNRLYHYISQTQPRAIHLHDPDLLRLAQRMAGQGIRIVYDVHEDFTLALLSRSWLGPMAVRQGVARLVGRLEARARRWCDARVLADRQLLTRFPDGVVVRNYLEPSEWPALGGVEASDQALTCVYVGDITVARGLDRMFDAIAAARAGGLAARLDLVGPFRASDRDRLQDHAATPHVTWHGRRGRAEVSAHLAQADLAFCLTAPTPAYLEALPVKVLEYIVSGLPVLATDTPRLRAEPKLEPALHLVDWSAPAEALGQRLIDLARQRARHGHPERAHLRQTVLGYYAWPSEAQELLALYERLLPGRAEPQMF